MPHAEQPNQAKHPLVLFSTTLLPLVASNPLLALLVALGPARCPDCPDCPADPTPCPRYCPMLRMSRSTGLARTGILSAAHHAPRTVSSLGRDRIRSRPTLRTDPREPAQWPGRSWLTAGVGGVAIATIRRQLGSARKSYRASVRLNVTPCTPRPHGVPATPCPVNGQHWYQRLLCIA